MDTCKSPLLTHSTTTCQRDRGQKSVLDSLKHTAEHGRIAPACASKHAHEPEECRLAQARVLSLLWQFEEARKECFKCLEHPFAFATVCVAIYDEERVVMVTVMVMVRGCEGVVGSMMLLVVIVAVLLGGEGGY